MKEEGLFFDSSIFDIDQGPMGEPDGQSQRIAELCESADPSDRRELTGLLSMVFLANCLKVKKEGAIEELRFSLDDLLTFLNQRLALIQKN